MTEYSILSSNVPVGGTAVANVLIEDENTATDVTSLRVIWKDHNGTLISDDTYSGTDISVTGADGGAVTITNPAGDGNYKATYTVPNDGTYSPTSAGLSFTCRIVATTSNGTDDETFTFKVVPSSVEVSLDAQATIPVIRRKAHLIEDKGFVLKASQTAVSLGHPFIYGIDHIEKNGTELTITTDYTHAAMRPNIVLVSAASDNDFLFVRIKIRLSDSAITDYVREAERYIKAKLVGFYNDTSLLTYPTVVNLIIDRAVGRIKEDLSSGIALESAHYRSGRDLKVETDAIIRMIQNGEAAIVDNTGAAVTRKAGSVVGGFKHSDGTIADKQDLRDRLAEYSKIAMPFHPFGVAIDGSE